MADNGEEVIVKGKPISSLRVLDLKQELKKRGLPHNGTKSQLLSRLKAQMSLEKLQQEPVSEGLPNQSITADESVGSNSFIQQYLKQQQELLAQREALHDASEHKHKADVPSALTDEVEELNKSLSRSVSEEDQQMETESPKSVKESLDKNVIDGVEKVKEVERVEADEKEPVKCEDEESESKPEAPVVEQKDESKAPVVVQKDDVTPRRRRINRGFNSRDSAEKKEPERTRRRSGHGRRSHELERREDKDEKQNSSVEAVQTEEVFVKSGTVEDVEAAKEVPEDQEIKSEAAKPVEAKEPEVTPEVASKTEEDVKNVADETENKSVVEGVLDEKKSEEQMTEQESKKKKVPTATLR